MGLTDALFAGTSGLRSLGHGMSVVGDNVSNLNTTAFKGSRITFSDIMAQRINTTSGSGQMGRGAAINALYPTMQQGSFESTASPTDLAIAGNGFFILKSHDSSGNTYYTRDGQFLIEKRGYLVNPAGFRVQGWQIDEVTGDITGALTDIQIQRSSPPVQTSKIDVITNLDAREELETKDITIEGDIDSGTQSTTFVVRDINGKDIKLRLDLTWDNANQKWNYTITNVENSQILAQGADTTATRTNIKLPITEESIALDWSNVTHEPSITDGLLVPGRTGRIELSDPNGYADTWMYKTVTVKDANGNNIVLDIWLYYQDTTAPPTTDFPAEIQSQIPNLSLANGVWHYVIFQEPSVPGSYTNPASDTGTLLSWGVDQSSSDTLARFFLDGTTQELTVDWSNVTTPNAAAGTAQEIANEQQYALQDINTLYEAWDARNDTPLPSTSYNYRTTLTVYDSLGTPHEITIFYDRTTRDNVYEFLVTCDPNEDQRDFLSDTVAMQWTKETGNIISKVQIPSGQTIGQVKRGVLMYGRMEFDNQGNIKKFYETYRVDPDTGALVEIVNENGSPENNPADGYEVLGPHGYPVILADFLGLNLDNDPAQSDEQRIEAHQNIQQIEFNTGYYYKDGAWRSESVRTTQYATSNSTVFYDQDGYGPGYLESISVDTDGVLTGHYSNGRVIPLWMVGLANFNAPEMLDKAGGNLYKETTRSGPPVTGKPGTNGLGSIAPNSLEQSNVDLGEQFVKMITIQRGFQADARIITVTDTMLDELLNLKR